MKFRLFFIAFFSLYSISFLFSQEVNSTKVTSTEVTTTSTEVTAVEETSTDNSTHQQTQRTENDTVNSTDDTIQQEQSTDEDDAVPEEKIDTSEDEILQQTEDITEEPTGTVIPEPERKPLEIEGVDNPLTVKYREHYLTNAGRQWLAKSLADSERYRPYVRQKLAENNLPMLLQYLPIVESNYKTTAVSSAGAVGIWQFMTNSMSPFLKKNTWYDERRDPWKSTDAAVRKLSDNYKMFGDWAIAIAAYNCGSGAMARLISKYPGKDFWYLAENGLLRSQSAQYVPKLLAIADIIENAEYYGAIDIGAADKIIEDAPVEEFDYVSVAGMFSLSQIAKATGISKDELYFLNPALFRNCTPAREVYSLRVPKDTGKTAEEALKKQGVATDAITYVVKQGDSLWAISRKYNVTVDDLCEVNNIKENNILSIGQTLIVPIFKK